MNGATSLVEQSRDAYLIYTHGNFSIHERLLSSLDSERNDIFIHIDFKVGDIGELVARLHEVVKFSRLSILEQRVDVRWATSSQIDVELALYRTATSVGKYRYYHLLSGVDMPFVR